ncbi:hypothetical protein MD484_g8075, partial [Candolleomyces efflorescens]
MSIWYLILPYLLQRVTPAKISALKATVLHPGKNDNVGHEHQQLQKPKKSRTLDQAGLNGKSDPDAAH